MSFTTYMFSTWLNRTLFKEIFGRGSENSARVASCCAVGLLEDYSLLGDEVFQPYGSEESVQKIPHRFFQEWLLIGATPHLCMIPVEVILPLTLSPQKSVWGPLWVFQDPPICMLSRLNLLPCNGSNPALIMG